MKTTMFALALIATLGVAARANATTQSLPGQLCQKLDSSVAGTTYSGTFGVYDVSTSNAMTIACPIPAVNPPSVSGGSFRVVTYDRNPVQDIQCTLMVNDENGVTQWSSTKASSGSNQAAQPLNYAIGATIGTYYTMWCSVPVVYAALNAYSHVANYSLTTP